MNKKDFQISQKMPQLELHDTLKNKNASHLQISPVYPPQSTKMEPKVNKQQFTFNMKILLKTLLIEKPQGH